MPGTKDHFAEAGLVVSVDCARDALVFKALLFCPACSDSQALFVVSGDILEIGAQWAIAKKDVEAFERYMAQLKCYYLDYKCVPLPWLSTHRLTFCSFSMCTLQSELLSAHFSWKKRKISESWCQCQFLCCRDDLPESSFKSQLLGLNLLRLLAQNKLSDFHTVGFCRFPDGQCFGPNLQEMYCDQQDVVDKTLCDRGSWILSMFSCSFGTGVGVTASQGSASKRLHQTSSFHWTVSHGGKLQQGKLSFTQLPVDVSFRARLNITWWQKKLFIAGVLGARERPCWKLQLLHWHSVEHHSVCCQTPTQEYKTSSGMFLWLEKVLFSQDPFWCLFFLTKSACFVFNAMVCVLPPLILVELGFGMSHLHFAMVHSVVFPRI